MKRTCLLVTFAALCALCACHKPDSPKTDEPSKTPAAHEDSSSSDDAEQTTNDEETDTPKLANLPTEPLVCGNETLPPEEAKNWVCLDDVLMCFSKEGCTYHGAKIPDRVKRFKGVFYCGNSPMPSRFDGLTCFDEMTDNIGSRFDENFGLVCMDGTCQCGNETLTPPQGCISEETQNLPSFQTVHPNPKRLRNTTIRDNVMYCGDQPFPAHEYARPEEYMFICVSGEWLCAGNCRCSPKESSGRFGHCKDGLSYCGNTHNNRPRNEETFTCRNGSWLCTNPYGCDCGSKTCTQNQICDGKKCSGTPVVFPDEFAGTINLGKCGNPETDKFTLSGPKRVLAKKNDPQLRCNIRRFCDPFFIPKDQYSRYTCDLRYDYVVSYDATTLDIRDTVSGLRCNAKEGCACSNDTCPYGALCIEGRCVLDKTYAVRACNNNPMIFSRETIMRECLFDFGSERYTKFFKPHVDPKRLPYAGELDECILDMKKWSDDYLDLFEYSDGSTWLINSIDQSYYMTPEGDCKCGHAILPQSMVDAYECDATIGYVCKKQSGCACGSATCALDQACLRPGVCADAT